MANKLIITLNSILPQAGSKMRKRKSESFMPIKHYTFMVWAEGILKHVNIVAPDKKVAQQRIEIEYPDCKTNFLWEYRRTTVADFSV